MIANASFNSLFYSTLPASFSLDSIVFNELKSYVHLVTTDQNAIILFNNYNLYSGYDLTEYLEET